MEPLEAGEERGVEAVGRADADDDPLIAPELLAEGVVGAPHRIVRVEHALGRGVDGHVDGLAAQRGHPHGHERQHQAGAAVRPGCEILEPVLERLSPARHRDRPRSEGRVRPGARTTRPTLRSLSAQARRLAESFLNCARAKGGEVVASRQSRKLGTPRGLTDRGVAQESRDPGGLVTRADVCSRCLVLALLSMLPAAASGASYRFVVLADSAAGARPLSAMPPSIDENGAVAFVTSEDGFEGMLLVASGPGAGTSADYTTVHAGLRLHAGRTQIGRFGAGRLAYWDDTFPRSTIYRWAGGAPVPVDTVVGIQDAPAMSDLGEIAFFDEDDEVVATDGVEKSVIARRDLEFADGEVIDNLNRPAPDMDGAGRVAYFASLETAEPTCDDRILLSGTDPPLVIASGGVLRTDCPFGNLLATVPIAVNDAASAAYAGDFWTPQDPFVDAVFVDETVVWDRRFAGFEDVAGLPVVAVALNDAGLVSFLLEFSGAIGRKLYVGPDPSRAPA